MKLKKKWNNLLLITIFISIIIASGECDSNILFYTKGLISCFIIIINGLILVKYGRI